MTRYCFSIDGGESYRDGEHQTRDEALRGALEYDSTLTEIHTGTIRPIDASELAEAAIDGDAIAERLAEAAGELVGGAGDTWPSFSQDNKEFKGLLNKMAAQLTWFLNEQDKPDFWQVEDTHEHTVAEINVMKAEIEAVRKAAVAEAKASTTQKETTE